MSQGLTKREADVLRWLALGLPNKEIGIRLGIQEQTVKNHMHSIYSKLMPERSGGGGNKTYRIQLALRMCQRTFQ